MYFFSRVVNLLRAECSVALSRFGIGRVRHLPTFVSVEPANFCQLHCPECPVGQARHNNRPTPLLSMPLFERILSQVAATAHTMQFYFQGEPLLNPELPQMIRRAHAVGLYTIVSTNAQALTPELAQALVDAGLNRIIVSIDGFSQDSYAAYRVGGSLEKALAGLRALRVAKKHHHCTIVLQVLRLRTNEQEWDWIRANYRRLGADRLEFKTAQLYDYEHGNPLMPTDTRYSRYQKGADGLYHPKRTMRAFHPAHLMPCRRLWTGCVITTGGEVLPCCYDKAAAHSFGNIMQQDLHTIYHSDRAVRFRKAVLQHHESIEICKNCLP